MKLYVLVEKSSEELKLITNVRAYSRGSRYAHIRVYDNIGAAKRSKTVLSKQGIKTSIIELDISKGEILEDEK